MVWLPDRRRLSTFADHLWALLLIPNTFCEFLEGLADGDILTTPGDLFQLTFPIFTTSDLRRPRG